MNFGLAIAPRIFWRSRSPLLTFPRIGSISFWDDPLRSRLCLPFSQDFVDVLESSFAPNWESDRKHGDRHLSLVDHCCATRNSPADSPPPRRTFHG
ncbi:MAG: hypothetical protein AAGA60_07150 [Cyanobacteria bacterium P01_E01_bin.42]